MKLFWRSQHARSVKVHEHLRRNKSNVHSTASNALNESFTSFTLRQPCVKGLILCLRLEACVMSMQ